MFILKIYVEDKKVSTKNKVQIEPQKRQKNTKKCTKALVFNFFCLVPLWFRNVVLYIDLKFKSALMNFLAHMFLSCDQEALLVGNFLADYVKNKELEQYAEGVRNGIILHRKIDSYTDNHPEVLNGVRRLYSHHSKYAAVIVDVWYDYLLAQNWERYSDQSLESFTQSVYNILNAHLSIMPAKMQGFVPQMIADNWLMGYGQLEGIAYTFERMRRRLSKPEYLDGVMESMKRDLPLLEEEFKRFFPDVIAYVQQECIC